MQLRPHFEQLQITWVEQQAAENRVTRSFLGSLLSDGFGLSLPFSDGFGFRVPSPEKVNLDIPGRSKSSLSWDGPAEAYACLDSKNPKAKPIYRSLNLNDEYWLRQYYIVMFFKFILWVHYPVKYLDSLTSFANSKIVETTLTNHRVI